MSVTTCPTAIVHVPIEQVWHLLAEPANYALWWDTQARAMVQQVRHD